MGTTQLKVTSAFLVDGKIAKVGAVVEVSESDAKDLLRRGKAEPVKGSPPIELPPETEPVDVSDKKHASKRK